MRLLHLAWWEPGEVDDPPPKLVKYLKLCLAGDVTAAECAAVLGTTPERVEEITTMEDS